MKAGPEAASILPKTWKYIKQQALEVRMGRMMNLMFFILLLALWKKVHYKNLYGTIDMRHAMLNRTGIVFQILIIIKEEIDTTLATSISWSAHLMCF